MEASPKRMPRYCSQEAVVGEELPSESESGLEDTVTDQLALRHPSGEDKEPKRSTIRERTLVVALRKVGQACLFCLFADCSQLDLSYSFND